VKIDIIFLSKYGQYLNSLLFLIEGMHNPHMKQIIERSALSVNLAKTLLYTFEYRAIYLLSRSFSLFVRPPHLERRTDLIEHLRNKVIEIHKIDAENIANDVYPIDVIIPKAPGDHVRNFPKLLLDSLRISRRRKLNLKNEINQDELGDAPDYLNRNYHFQTDGYFSVDSAKLYEHQVEILFSGTAAPMRRRLIQKIKEARSDSQPIRILELGAGVGTASVDFAKSFKFSSYVVSDVSSQYLEVAKKRLKGRFEFVRAKGEDLPFKDGEFDLVFSVYLFHELPRSVREKVITEAYRVLKKDGMIAICDSIQKDDDPLLNEVLDGFPLDYHEPFYKDYTLWDAKECMEHAGFKDIHSDHKLLSKYWTAKKDC
jgi:ubiquinone/menaquinone biosynthesis C-methylase UbiE